MTEQYFRELVADAIDNIPEKFARAMDNVAIVVEDEPSAALLADLDMEEGELMGLYQGTPLTERGAAFGNQLPDQITLFKRSIEAACDGDDELIVDEIGGTLIHELGHYFGMSEDEIMAIEDEYWYGHAGHDGNESA